MRASLLPLAMVAAALCAPAAPAQSAPAGFRDEFLGQLDASASKLVALAEAMPESAYAWSPGQGVMPVQQVYLHVARYNYEYPRLMGVAVPAGVALEEMESLTGKARVVEQLRASLEHVAGAVRAMPEAQMAQPARLYGRDVAQWAVLLQLLAHMNEHLGQSIAYARSNDVVPPWSR